MRPSHRRSRNAFQDPLELVPQALTKLYSMWVGATYPFASKGRKLSIHYTCEVRNPGLIEIGNSVIIYKDVWLHAVASPESDGEPALIIGDDCLIGRRSHITAKNRVHIEPDVVVSASVLIQDHGHAYNDVTLPIRLQGLVKGGRIRIGQGSWIGQGAAIVCTQGELVLGRNCVVAANALVNRSAPPYSVLAGNPAKVVLQFDPVKGTWVMGSSRPVGPELGIASVATQS